MDGWSKKKIGGRSQKEHGVGRVAPASAKKKGGCKKEKKGKIKASLGETKQDSRGLVRGYSQGGGGRRRTSNSKCFEALERLPIQQCETTARHFHVSKSAAGGAKLGRGGGGELAPGGDTGQVTHVAAGMNKLQRRRALNKIRKKK